jgi:hypothetical protein
VGVVYDQTPSADGGSGALTWSVADGTLPDGLTLDPSTGEITGTPTTAGTSTFTLVATDGAGGTATQDESVAVAASPSITSAPLSGGYQGTGYDAEPLATGGTGTLTWSVTDGSLPPGLTLDPTSGEVSGTPTGSGTSTFTLVVMDAAGGTATQAESVTVLPVLAITSDPYPGGEVGATYSSTAQGTGGTGTYTWAAFGTLPDGLTFDPSTGQLSGTPTQVGTSTFVLVLSDGSSPVTNQVESVTILAGPSITSDPLPGGEVGVAYDTTPAASGGSGAYSWSVASGSLPDGLTIDPSTGEVSGTPVTPGTSSFTLVATDEAAQVGTQSESVAVVAPLTLVPGALPGGETGVAYDVMPSVSGGSDPTTWSVVDGTLPAGLTLDPATGAITGTPTVPGTYSFTLRATDGLGGTSTAAVTLTVAGGPATMGTRTIDGNVGVAMTDQLDVSGGNGPFSWAVSAGSPPPGLSIDASTGEVSGTPTLAGTTSVTVTVSDHYGQHASGTVTFVVLPTALNSRTIAITPDGKGYWVATGDGKVAAFGDATSYGSMAGDHLQESVVGITTTPDGKGYWLVASDGGVFAFGDATFYGSEGSHHLNRPIVGMTTTPDGKGYWLVAADGGVFAFGDALFHGSAGAIHLDRPIVGMAATPDGQGYWLVASDGGVFSYGTAVFHGSEGDARLNRPIVGMAATPDGQGYWLVASDGGVFTFGDATFFGSAAGVHLNQPVDGIEATPDGRGYWLAAADGGVFTYGDAGFLGADPAPLQ